MILRRFLIVAVLGLAACGGNGGSHSSKGANEFLASGLHPNETPQLRGRINYWADHYQVPRSLVQRVVIRESSHRPEARNGPYYGLMQILPQTARTMGHRGAPQELLNADTNLQYAVKYLRGAYLVADGNQDEAVGWYARGYYYEAKRKGLLEETGLRQSRR
ncbi:lytic transglycosylase domain-containing protein [Paracoccus sp. DMF-8]|uniref:lytic transglycosylase domain-containing protein n=1 Tax=Paracoccus sp. DMF-8 TaxID=3019445 RepID=UPI0023E373C0|nr:lytic transglycosylase domain-containing protein [Paracoccus sp. DMF-8]MDF3607807.1 lytic transglycosylase domain-containing protein [Paracoccus sp. DMF-8]